MTGALLREGMLDNQDSNGMTLRQVLQRHGFNASEEAIAAIAMDPASVRGFDPHPRLQYEYAFFPRLTPGGHSRLHFLQDRDGTLEAWWGAVRVVGQEREGQRSV